MANTSVSFTDLDFISLKNSLKNYLRENPVFKDYDFEGSNINLLIDLLSYNSFKNSFLTNMLMSESFLDSAQLRNSVTSHAKELNYTPRSYRSSRASVRVTFQATGESAPYIIPKGSQLTTLIKNEAYTFTIPSSLIVASANTTYSFDTDIYEGTYYKDTYVYQPNIENQRFKITNSNVDTESLVVAVYEDNNSEPELYTQQTTFLDIGSTSKVYFLQVSEDGRYEVVFGDNIFGRKPKSGATIVLDYRTSSGTNTNGARQFSLDFDPTGSDEMVGTAEVELIEVARGGASRETIDSIKYYAPRYFQTQERTVTTDDYEVALKTKFPEINAVHAYGGETLTPSQYGKVFIAVDISDVEGFPESKKIEYSNFIKSRSPFSIRPVFVEPIFTYLEVDSSVRYNINVTSIDRETLRSKISNVVKQYRDLYLDDFNSTIRQSKLFTAIDTSDVSIVSSVTTVRPYKKIKPKLAIPQDIVIDFQFALIDTIPEKENVHKATDIHTVSSSLFYYNGQQLIIEDDGSGNLFLLATDGVTNQKITQIGTVNYQTGLLTITNLIVDRYEGNFLKIFCTPRDPDVRSSQNTILTIEDDEITIKLEELRV